MNTTSTTANTRSGANQAATRELAQLILPALRWHEGSGFGPERERIDQYLALGVGGFLLVGGTQDAVRTLAKELQTRSSQPLLIAADLERGAGQQFAGATGLPPLAAISALGDLEALRRAARLTAREARTMGVNWNLAPVCDLDILADNPIVGTRGLGSEWRRVGQLAAAWIEACQAEGVLACAKHFPGHGRAAGDSRLGLPVVDAPLDVLKEQDLAPFRAAIKAGVASIMAAHVSYPALDSSGLPATLSREILQWMLRQQLKFDNLVSADAADLPGVAEGRSEAEAAVLAVRAGVDVLLQPVDPIAMVDALEAARDRGEFDPEQTRRALRRRLKWAQWASPPNDWRRPSGADTAWGALLAERCLRVVNGTLPKLASVTEVATIDDDIDSPGVHAPRSAIIEALRAAGVDVRESNEPTSVSHGPFVIVVFGDRLPGKGRAWFAESTITRLHEMLAAAKDAQREVVLVACGEPRLLDALKLTVPTIHAWSADRVMQQAAARALARRK